MRRNFFVLFGFLFFIIAVAGAKGLMQGTGISEEPFERLSKNSEALYAEGSSASTPWLVTSSSTETVNVPILVYHIVRPSFPNDSRAVRAFALTPQLFDAQLLYLTANGYHVVTFGDLEDNLRNGRSLPEKPIILSFDDGWSDQFLYAFPLLGKYHLTATFFVFTNALDRPGFLSWNNLHELIDAGMTIGSHTRSHPYLNTITNGTTLRSEIYDSKRLLEENLGITVNEFAYPFGQYNAAVVEVVQRAGYRSARGDYDNGKQSGEKLYELSAVNAPTSMALFEKKFP